MKTVRTVLLVAALLMPFGAAAYTAEDVAADLKAMDAIYARGDYPAAEAAVRKIADQARAAFGPDAQPVFDAELALANILRQQNRDAEGLDLFEDLHARATARLGEYHPFTVRLSMALAVALSENGRPQEALPLAIQTVRIGEAVFGPENVTSMVWRYNLAGIFSDLGYLEEARNAYGTALTFLLAQPDGQRSRYAATAARQIARVESQMGHPDLAADAYAVAIPLLEQAFGKDHPTLAITLSEYALELWRSDRRAAMPVVLDRAEALSRAVFGEESVVQAQVLSMRALLVEHGGGDDPRMAPALALQAEAVAMLERQLSPTSKQTGKALLDYAAMLTDTSDPVRMREGLAVLRRAEAADNASRNFTYSVLRRAEEIGALTATEAAEEVLRVAQQSQGSAAAAASLKYATRLVMGEGDAAQTYRAATDLMEREAQIQTALVTIAERPKAERDPVSEQGLRDELARTTPEISRLWGELRKSYPSLSDLTGDGTLSLAEVQALLGPDEAAVVVDIGPHDGDRHVIIAISKDAVMWRELLWTTDSFSSAVADARAGISMRLGVRAAAALDGEEPARTDPMAFDYGATQFLYAETLGQVEEVFRGKAHLYLDLRGAMAALPPHLLIRDMPVENDPTKADWLIRHHALTVVPSLFSLKTTALARGRARAAEPLLAFADPVFDLKEDAERLAALDTEGQAVLRGNLSPLPETAEEVRQVAATLGATPAALRLGAAASEAALKESPLESFRVLHFATHGLVTGDVAGGAVLGEPALALTPGRGEDGFLTVSEILGLHLNSDWVVLSACNTAVGNDPDAEALSGLAQAFFYAGARALLVSHWPVESRSAAHLMTETFRLRAATPGIRAAEAQRQAMLAMIDHPPKAGWNHPAYWAPFVLVGNPD